MLLGELMFLGGGGGAPRPNTPQQGLQEILLYLCQLQGLDSPAKCGYSQTKSVI